MVRKTQLVRAIGLGLLPLEALVCISLLTACTSPAASQPEAPVRTFRVGYLSAGRLETSPTREALVDGLRELGYVEGSNLHIEYRFAGDYGLEPPQLAQDLLKQELDVIVAVGSPLALAAKAATDSVPIVMVAVADPVESGLVKTLRQPGGNVTGTSSLNGALASKRIEFIKAALPGTLKIGVFVPAGREASGTPAMRQWVEMEAAARALKMEIVMILVPPGTNADEIKARLQASVAGAKEAGVDALAPVGDALFDIYRNELAGYAADYGLPSMYTRSDFADGGGLFAYGADSLQQARRAAGFVVRIIKGEKAGEMPVELPSSFEIVVNLKTAQRLGLAVTNEALAQATRVIQ